MIKKNKIFAISGTITFLGVGSLIGHWINDAVLKGIICNLSIGCYDNVIWGFTHTAFLGVGAYTGLQLWKKARGKRN